MRQLADDFEIIRRPRRIFAAWVPIINEADVDLGARRDFGRIAAVQVDLGLAISRRVFQVRAPGANIKAAVMADGDRRLQREIAATQRYAAEPVVGDEFDPARNGDRARCGLFFLRKGRGRQCRRGEEHAEARLGEKFHWVSPPG